MLLPETLLDRMIHAIVREALNGLDRCALYLHREECACFRSPAIDIDDARAALAGIASDMRAGQPEMVAQIVDEERARLNFRRSLHSIDGHRHECLLHLLGIGQVGPLFS